MTWGLLDWVAVALLGGLVGTSELISRYKDDPWAAIRNWPARFYIAINGAASVGALGVIHANGWFGPTRDVVLLESNPSRPRGHPVGAPIRVPSVSERVLADGVAFGYNGATDLRRCKL